MITTERLNIKPLSYDMFKEYISNRCGSIKTDQDALWVIENHLFKLDGKHDLFATWWLGINEDDEVVAEAAFKGKPNKFGEVEIGMYVMESQRSNGYGNEIVMGLTKWASEQDGVEFVIAGVKPDNLHSQRIFKNNNFVMWGEKEGMMVFYKKSKN